MLAALQGSQDLRGTAQLKPARNRPPAMSPKLSKKELGDRIQALCVLVVDDNQYMRKTIRNLLVNCGVKDICEAADGIAVLDTLRTVGPDVVLLDWEMPLLNGAEIGAHCAFARRVSDAPCADHHAQRTRRTVACAGGDAAWRQRISDQAGLGEGDLRRLVSITLQRRPTVRLGDYYVPEPRRLAGEGVEDVDQSPSLVP